MKIFKCKTTRVWSIIILCITLSCSLFSIIAMMQLQSWFLDSISDVTIELSALTQVVLTNAYLCITPVLAVASIVKEVLIQDKRLTLIVNFAHLVLILGLFCAFLSGILIPLMCALHI